MKPLSTDYGFLGVPGLNGLVSLRSWVG